VSCVPSEIVTVLMVLTDSVFPRLTKSSTDKEDPKRTPVKTDSLLPTLQYDRIDIAAPSEEKSITDKPDPKRAMPQSETAEPIRA